MITKELIDRINYLARKKKETGLTADEELEQAVVRRQYIDAIKDQIRPALEAARAGKTEELPHLDGCGCDKCKH